MKTLFENLVAAGARVSNCPNGTAVELCGHLWVFTETQKELWGEDGFTYMSTPFSTKLPVVLVEEVNEGTHIVLQHRIPTDGKKKYKVFC